MAIATVLAKNDFMEKIMSMAMIAMSDCNESVRFCKFRIFLRFDPILSVQHATSVSQFFHSS